MRAENRCTYVTARGLALATSLLLAAAAELEATPPEVPSGPGCDDCTPTARSAVIEDISAAARFTLRAAHRAARRKLFKDDACRALFDALDLEGTVALSHHRYRSPQSASERAHCDRGVLAFTQVGSSQILLCGKFHHLNRRKKAAILIHEALHTAGLDEAPNDPEGMTSLEITRAVRKACSL